MGISITGNENTVKEDATFLGATFQKELEFTPEENGKLDFRYTRFFFRSYITADLSEILFHRAFLDNVVFANCKWPKNRAIFEETYGNTINLTSS